MYEAVVDKATLDRLTEQLSGIRNGVEIAASRAINKVAVSARVKIVRALIAHINLTQAELKRRNLKLFKANRRQLIGAITVRGARIPLKHFGARQTKQGITYRLKPGSPSKIPHAFLATMKSGHEMVALREPLDKAASRYRKPGGGRGKTGNLSDPRRIARMNELEHLRASRQLVGVASGLVPRLPIGEKRGPSIPGVFEKAQELAESTFNAEIASRMSMELDRQAAVLLEQNGRMPAPSADESEGGNG